MKNFTPKAGIVIMYLIVMIIILAFLAVLWIILGVHGLTISLTIVCGLFLFIIFPIGFKTSLKVDSIIINEQNIMYYEMTILKPIKYILRTIEIDKIQNLKLVSKKEVKLYDRSCKAKQILLFDLGKDGYRYINVTLFSKKFFNNLLIL